MPVFYHKLVNLLRDKLPNKTDAQTIKNIIKKGQVKQEEIKWSGIEEFLENKTKLTKDEVIQFVRENSVRLKEQLRGEITTSDKETINKLWKKQDDLAKKLKIREKTHPETKELHKEFYQLNSEAQKPGITESQHTIVDKKRQNALRKLEEQRRKVFPEIFEEFKKTDKQIHTLQNKLAPQYKKYTLLGGWNYQELLLSLPEKAPKVEVQTLKDGWAVKINDKVTEFKKGSIRKLVTINTKEDAIEVASKLYKEVAPASSFETLHWPGEKDVVLHVRFNEHTDLDGKRVLLIEELQSDWHQKGRSKGYIDPGLTKERDKLIEKINEYHKTDAFRKDVEKYGELEAAVRLLEIPEYAEMAAKAKALNKQLAEVGPVPDAPFKKTWHEVGLRRMLRWGAKKDFDKIAWTTGKQQTERYSLRQVADALYYTKEGEKYNLVAMKDNEAVFTKDGLTAEQLEEYVGKDITKKIITGEGVKTDLANQFTGQPIRTVRLEGDNLEAGTTGMFGFYDKILVDYMNKYGKKWGVRVGETSVVTGNIHPTKDPMFAARETVHSVDITPEMKQSVLQEGQPLFSKTFPAGAIFGVKKDEEGNITFDPVNAVKGMAAMAVGEAGIKLLIKNYKAAGKMGIVAPGFTKPKSPKVEKIIEKARAGKTKLDKGTLPGEKKGFRKALENLEHWFENIPRTPFEKTNVKRRGAQLKVSEHIETDAREIKKEFQAKVNASLINEGKGLKNRAYEANVRSSAATLIMDDPTYIHTRAFEEDVAEIRRLWKANKMPESAFKKLDRTIELADKPTDDVLWLVEKLQDSYLQLGRYAEDEGLLRNFREHYITHIWKNLDITGKKVSPLTIKKSFKYSKERTIPTYIEGLKLGLDPRTMNAIELNSIYQKTLASVVADRHFVKALEGLKIDGPDNIPILLSSANFNKLKALDKRMYTPIDSPAFRQYSKRTVKNEKGVTETIWQEANMYLHRDYAKDIYRIFGTSKMREMPLALKVMRVNNFYKRMKLAASGFHYVALGMNNFLLGGDKWYKFGNPMPFDIGSWKSVSKQGLKDLRNKDKFLDVLLENQLTLRESGAAADYHKTARDNLTKWIDTKDPNMLRRMDEMRKKGMGVWDDAMWDKYYAGSKVAIAKIQYAKWLKVLKRRKEFKPAYQAWQAEGFPTLGKTEYEKVAAQHASRDVNDLYGGLNIECMKISKTTWDLLRTAILAPDWTISNWRYTINGVREMVKYPTSSVTAQQTIKMMLTLGALGTMINYKVTGHAQDENPAGTKSMVAVGKNTDGKMMYVDLYRHFGEFFKVLKHGDKERPLRYLYESPVRYSVNKSSQIIRMLDMIRTGEDWRGRPLATFEDLKNFKLSGSKYTPWYERGSSLPGVALMVLVESGIPIPVTQSIRAATGNEPASAAVMSIFGIHAKEEPERWNKKSKKLTNIRRRTTTRRRKTR